MRNRYALMCVILMMFSTLTPVVLASSYQDYGEDHSVGNPTSTDPVETTTPMRTNDIRIGVNFMDFDPLVEGPPTPPTGFSDNNGLWLVQFDGPVQQSWKSDIEGLGADLQWYQPDYTFVVRADQATVMTIEEYDHVRWVGPFTIDYKLHPELWWLEERTEVMVSPLEDHRLATADLERAGATIRYSEIFMVVAAIDGADIMELAQSPNIGYMGPAHKQEVINNNAGRIIKARQNSDGAFAGDGQSLWSFNSGNFPGHSGNGVTVAVLDTGVDGNHPTFNTPGKKVFYKDYCTGSTNTWTDSGSHGTHVAGIAVGNGNSTGTYAGMAPNGKLVGMRTLNCGGLNAPFKDAIDNGATMTSNSWVEWASYGNYDALASGMDAYTRDGHQTTPGDQPLLHVCGAGNDGANGVQPPATAKNVIAVGAVGDNRGTSSNTVAGFSGKGPTDDSRIKPDIVTPGVQVYSARKGQTTYTAMTGTSMATPAASGGLVIMKQYYIDQHGFEPSPALTKAIMINGADILAGYSWPGNSQGWGRMNVANSLLETATKKIDAVEQNDSYALQTGFQASMSLTINSGAELRVTLVWTDEPGATNNPNPSLVNDLDLVLTSPSDTKYLGNRIVNKVSTTGGSSDTINNIEGIRLTSPATGSWSLDIAGTNIPKGPQDWALVVSGDMSLGQPSMKFVEIFPSDLRVEPSPAVEGDNIIVKATVKNSGTMPAPIFGYELSFDFTVVDSGTIPMLAPGATQDLEVPVSGDRGSHIVSLIIDKAKAVIELDDDNNTLDLEFTIDHYGLELSASKTKGSMDPGEETTFFFDVSNTGSIEDNYTVEVSVEGDRSEEWTVSQEHPDLTIPSGEDDRSSISITAPGRIEARSQLKAYVTVTSQGNISYTDTITFTVDVNMVTGIEGFLEPDEGSVLPSRTFQYDLTINNTGNDEDIITFRIDSQPPGWDARFNVSIGTLSAYTDMDLELTVQPPSMALAGELGVVAISATNSNDETLTFTTVTTVEQEYGMEFTTEQIDEHVLPGEDANFDITMVNIGNGEDIVQLEVDVPEGFIAEFDTDEIELIAFEESYSTLTVTPPEDALADDYEIIVSGNSTNSSFEETFIIAVDQVQGLELTVDPTSATIKYGAFTTFDILVKNTGNDKDTFKIFVERVKSPMTSSLSRPQVDLGPSEEATVVLTINSNTIEGGLYGFSVKVLSSDTSISDEETLRIEVESKPKPKPPPGPIPGPFVPDDPDGDAPWYGAYANIWCLGPMVALVLILFIVLIAFVRYRKRKRLRSGPRIGEDGAVGDMGQDDRARYRSPDRFDLLSDDAEQTTFDEMPIDDGPSPQAGPPRTYPRRIGSTPPSSMVPAIASPARTDEVSLQVPPEKGPSPIQVPAPVEEPVQPLLPEAQPPSSSEPTPQPVQEPTTPMEPEGPAPSPEAKESPEPEPKKESDEIDSMITNLLGNL